LVVGSNPTARASFSRCYGILSEPRHGVVFGKVHAYHSAFVPIAGEGYAGTAEFALQSIQTFGRYVELGRPRAGFDVGAELCKVPRAEIGGAPFDRMRESAATALTSLAAVATLWFRRRSVLDLWLMVVMCAYAIEIVLVSFPVPARFTVGWYGGWVLGLFSASLVLIVLLVEIAAVYAGLLNALVAQRTEREARLLTGNAVAAMIAHEIKQPLITITARAQAG
jgi:hypothetical protein